MRHTIAQGPTFTTLEFDCAAGDAVTAQPGAMLGMTPGFELTAKVGAQMQGKGISRAFRSMAVGESFFAAVYTAKRDGEQLTLAPENMGDIRALEVNAGNRYLVAGGAFLACTGKVQLDASYAGVKGLMSTRGLFLLKAEGEGQLFIASYGALIQRDLAEGQRYVLDNRYIVAFTRDIRYEMVKVAGSLRHSFLSGEGFVNRFTGPGTILYQTRARPSQGFLRGLFQLAT
jgi:uncharacterized protein (TIGR00266 family)